MVIFFFFLTLIDSAVKVFGSSVYQSNLELNVRIPVWQHAAKAQLKEAQQ